MKTDTTANELEKLLERLETEQNEAIEGMISFLSSHAPECVDPERKTPVIEKRVKGAFARAELMVYNDPEATLRTAEEARRIADEAEKNGVDPDVNKKAYQRAFEFLYTNFCNYCADPEDGLEEALEFYFSQYMTTRIWGSVTPLQPTAPSTEEEEESFLPMVHGKATDAMASMVGRPLAKNTLNDTAFIEANGAKMVVAQYSQTGGSLGVSTHQLLCRAITEFTKLNHTGSGKRSVRVHRVTIPLKDYLRLKGYDIDEHPTHTDEEKKAEKKRVKTERDNGRKQVKKDLEFLFHSHISWSEKVRGKEQDFLDVHYLGAKGIEKGEIVMEFTDSMAQYLIQLPITQYPDPLYLADGNHASAYAMGLKMWEHYNMDNNQKQGTAQLLRVKNLLEEAMLPTYESLGKNRLDWKLRIKDPFEDALEYLVQIGTLEDWRYSFSKGEEMTDEEATNFSGYEDWAETLIHFTLKDAPDHTARLEAKEEKRKESASKKKKK